MGSEMCIRDRKFYLLLDCPTPTVKATTVKQDRASTTVKPVEGTTRAATTQVNNQDNCPPADFCSNRADGTYAFEVLKMMKVDSLLVETINRMEDVKVVL